ncbi:MAG: 16S rRNA (guanine(527)-N(7))-methyltransferase RsmG [bacterium]|nr:16S rRNA (guanine(527)-N(7))-methyltransferase RsmG [bacterium]
MDAGAEFGAALTGALEQIGLDLSPERLEVLTAHYQFLVEANRRFNLTRKTEPAEAARWLYADSLAVAAWTRQANRRIGRVLDVGSGGGFPAFPLAVLEPTWRVTALEATGKKVRFIEESADRCGVVNLQAVHDHSDHFKTRQRFDLVTFKAVASLDRCLTIGQRFANAGGCIAVYKTHPLDAGEARDGLAAAEQWGLRPLPRFEYELPGPTGPVRLALHLFVRRSRR